MSPESEEKLILGQILPYDSQDSLGENYLLGTQILKSHPSIQVPSQTHTENVNSQKQKKKKTKSRVALQQQEMSRLSQSSWSVERKPYFNKQDAAKIGTSYPKKQECSSCSLSRGHKRTNNSESNKIDDCPLYVHRFPCRSICSVCGVDV